jgi:hypothetical protein
MRSATSEAGDRPSGLVDPPAPRGEPFPSRPSPDPTGLPTSGPKSSCQLGISRAWPRIPVPSTLRDDGYAFTIHPKLPPSRCPNAGRDIDLITSLGGWLHAHSQSLTQKLRSSSPKLKEFVGGVDRGGGAANSGAARRGNGVSRSLASRIQKSNGEKVSPSIWAPGGRPLQRGLIAE